MTKTTDPTTRVDAYEALGLCCGHALSPMNTHVAEEGRTAGGARFYEIACNQCLSVAGRRHL